MDNINVYYKVRVIKGAKGYTGDIPHDGYTTILSYMIDIDDTIHTGVLRLVRSIHSNRYTSNLDVTEPVLNVIAIKYVTELIKSSKDGPLQTIADNKNIKVHIFNPLLEYALINNLFGLSKILDDDIEYMFSDSIPLYRLDRLIKRNYHVTESESVDVDNLIFKEELDKKEITYEKINKFIDDDHKGDD
ncbi:MAG: hypothetical protein K9L56_15225 [Clostridiales bacterium]|nr:hypothetical protein [Clostridiales bacterium]